MKRKLTNNFLLFFLILSGVASAQTYTCTIQNQLVNGNDFSFDIYMQRTDATETYLGNSEFSLEFNNQNFNSPQISFEPSSPELDWYTVDAAIPVGYPNIVKFSVGALTFSNQTQFDNRVCRPATIAPGTLIATITISSQSILISGTAGLQWRTTAPHDSKINTYAPTSPWKQTNITSNGTYTNPPDVPLPVELSSFSAKYNDESVRLNWITKTEVNNYGFNVERRINEGEWNTLGFVKGHGNSNSLKEYRYTDNDLFAGGSKFQYRLKQLDNDGSFEYSDVIEVEILPTKFELSQNYPNPFNPSTTIRFSLPKETQLKINIYNMLGELVRTIAEGNYEAGYHKITVNAADLPSGAYIYRIESPEFVQVKKMVLIK
jgi:hypothetical protein